MELTYLFRSLWRNKWIVLICVLVAVAIAFLATRGSKKEYTSIAQFSTGFTVSEDIKLSNENFNLPQIELKFNNVIENISSARVLTLVSYHLLLHDLKSNDPFTKLTPVQKSSKAFQDAPSPEKAIALLTAKLDSQDVLNVAVPAEKALGDLLAVYNYDDGALTKELKINRYERTDYINIVCKTENPNLSSFIANTLYDEFRRYYNRDKRQRTTGAVNTLDSLLKQKKSVLDEKVLAKNQYMTTHGVVDVSLEGSSKLSQIGAFESQLIEEKSILKNMTYRQQQLDTLIRSARSKGLTTVASPVNTSPGSTGGGGANGEYMKLREQYTQLYSDYLAKGGNDPEMKKKLDAISKQMSNINLVDASGSPLDEGSAQRMVTVDQLVQKRIDAEAQIEASRQKISSVEAKLNQLYGGLNGMAAQGASIQQFDKEIQIASAEYTAAKDALNVATNLGENNNGNFKQTLVAEPALKPEPSKKAMIIGLSGVAAFFIASLIIIFLEFIDQSIKTPSQFQRLTGLPLLGTVNGIKLNGTILETIAIFDEKEKHRNNTFLEVLRKLRYEIESSGKKIFLFSSTEPQQGKTMLIQALSYILSLGKKRVLIIDTNFCNNDLTMATNAMPALEKFDLNGKPFDKKDILPLISRTSVSKIDIIGCAGGDYTPTEILPKNHLLNYLKQLEGEYDFIFMEGAPLNGFTDTKELERYAEGLIAIFSAEAALTPADKESIRFFHEHKDKFLGAILNKVEEPNLEM